MTITRETCIVCKEHVGHNEDCRHSFARTSAKTPLLDIASAVYPMPCHSLQVVRIQELLMEGPQHSRMGKVICSNDDKSHGFRL